MLVLIWGLEADPPVVAVWEQLQLLGTPTRFIDQRRVLETHVDLVVGEGIEALVRVGDDSVDLGEVTAVYLRPYESVRLPEIAAAGPDSATWKHASQVDDILSSWSEIAPALVVNRCSAMAPNGSKPYQLEQIRSLGWNVPETLITTDPVAARAFWKHHSEVVYKSVGSVRSRVSRLGPEHVERLTSVTPCPTQFQEYIAGVDHRVHVVGEEVFACEVRCTSDDYRYSGDSPVEILACSLPRDVEDKCRDLAKALHLPLAGIDLRRTAAGEWFCFEVNPSPAFTYYEELACQPIGQAVARLLTRARRQTMNLGERLFGAGQAHEDVGMGRSLMPEARC